jgi:ferredoxin
MAISHLQNQAKSRNIPTHVPNNQLSNESIPTRRHVTFIDKEGQNHTFEVADGDNLLDIAQGSSLQSPKLRSHKARLHLQKELATFQLPFHPPKPLLRFHPYHFTTDTPVLLAHDLEMEGACGGSCACSTCHVIVTSPEMYDRIPEPDDDENDMLDLAFGLTETSRLGCQVKMTADLDGLEVRLPSMTRNMQASDFVEKKREEGG